MTSAAIVAPDFPAELAAVEAAASGEFANASSSQLFISTAAPMPIVTQVSFAQPSGPDSGAMIERRRAPALVIDLGARGAAPAAGEPAALIDANDLGAAPLPAGPDASADDGFVDQDERFAARVGADDPENAQATLLRNPSAIVPQGAMIPGVLETALNSDLPGFARAVVSRDVRSFDGSRVLIPRGSRVIGQYSSGVSLGQSRAFVIWTRVITPDGVSIQIASPGADALGRGGMEGEVDRHFFQRFGGALLLSVVNAATAGLSDQPNTQIVIGSSQDAARLGSSVLSPTDIAPTIEVPQGTPIRIFVVRDLDFASVLQASTRGRAR
ncbi:MAG: type IV secretion system protein VirB10 [Phycisphaerales bacterium]|nr:type IV secretion system protein VirB10 [Hyphomonadaceae bacterium]